MRTGSPVDPDRDEARRWLEEELRAPDYEVRESLVLRVWRWVSDHLPYLDLPGRLPGWAAWALLGVVLLAAAAVVLFAARDRWRRGALAAAGPRGAVLEETGVTAAQYRRRADAAAAAGNCAAALLDAYRAIAAGAVERTLVDDRPGRTAHEVSLVLAPVLPREAGALAAAADAFDAVRYGTHRPSAGEVATVIELERRVASARPVLPGLGDLSSEATR
ncbi:DUF4129 domain-containing protein [Ornithinimicrobium pekingense]|uniref:Protein-glutamine gamma-glutamyltransferase-like C-terminal domain-containing protein n=1 Tax=Ornithinimicrobium pekingense TaxID=384677 RepID=A0ABQ2F5Q4_9MICO|nr:DUF4129 domain-containing protein [Ornithinimicrobium pekingense]GGK64774.1 hypothetical protein GCM10011509_11340 [Ornithinimicrobium pekingense]